MADSYETKLKEYIPEFLYDLPEIKYPSQAIDTQIKLLWDAENKRFRNHFIDSCDEDGIKVYEKILGITPDPDATLQDRRDYAKMMWNFSVPFSERYFLNYLEGICEEDFSYAKDPAKCEVYITVGLLSKPITKAMNDVFRRIMPAHELCIISRRFSAQGSVYMTGGSAFLESYDSTDTANIKADSNGTVHYGAAFSGTAMMTVTDTTTTDIESSQKLVGAGVLSYTELINTTGKDN